MKCRETGCNEQARYDGYCQYCTAKKWKLCIRPQCDQYTMDPSMLCYAHRSPEELMSISQVAELLGVSSKTIQRMSDSGRLPFIRTEGGHRRYKRCEVIEYMEETQ